MRVLLSGVIDITIRQAIPSDAPVIVDFNRRLAAETEHLNLDRETLGAGVAALLADPSKGIYFVALVDGVLVGQAMITYEWSDWRNGNIWWLQSVYVRQEFRRHGLFTRLFGHIRQRALEQGGVSALRLYMHADNSRARSCYQRLGMAETKYQVFERGLLRSGD